MELINSLQFYEGYNPRPITEDPMTDANNLPLEKEDIVFVRVESRYLMKCNACPKKVKKTYVLCVGDTRLLRLCACCKRRLLHAKWKDE